VRPASRGYSHVLERHPAYHGLGRLDRPVGTGNGLRADVTVQSPGPFVHLPSTLPLRERGFEEGN
jgi:hypothetical protein